MGKTFSVMGGHFTYRDHDEWCGLDFHLYHSLPWSLKGELKNPLFSYTHIYIVAGARHQLMRNPNQQRETHQKST